MNPRWPVRLQDGDLVLRPIGRRDADAWHRLRRSNAAWLRPWEATLPQPDPSVPSTYGGMVRGYRTEARAGRSLALGVDHADELVGQLTLGGISWGSLRSAYIGYWISEHFAGRGLMPRAVALLSDYALTEMGLHRIEINIRPENTASLRVVAKLGFRLEGHRHAYLHIDGDWRDHVTYVMLAEQLPPGGLLARVAAGRLPQSSD